MKNILIATAVASALIVPVVASAKTTLYGDVRYSMSLVDADNNTAKDGGSPAFASNASRVGIKGGSDLGNGMKSLFHIQMKLTALEQSSTTALENRFGFAGIKSNMGTVLFGNLSSPYKMAGLKLDPFYDTSKIGASGQAGDSGASYGLSSLTNGWFENVVAYVSPTFGGVHVSVVSVGDTGADRNAKNLGGSAYNYGIAYDNAGLSASVQFIDLNNTSNDATRFAASYKMGAVKVGASFEQTGADQDNLFVSVAYNLDKDLKLAATFGTQDNGTTNAAGNGSAFNLGAFYKLGKQTEVRATFSSASMDAANSDTTMFAFGFSQKFSM